MLAYSSGGAVKLSEAFEWQVTNRLTQPRSNVLGSGQSQVRVLVQMELPWPGGKAVAALTIGRAGRMGSGLAMSKRTKDGRRKPCAVSCQPYQVQTCTLQITHCILHLAVACKSISTSIL